LELQSSFYWNYKQHLIGTTMSILLELQSAFYWNYNKHFIGTTISILLELLLVWDNYISWLIIGRVNYIGR